MKRVSKHLSIVLVLILLAISTKATTYETVKNGNWNAASTWKNNKKPSTYMNPSHTVKVYHDLTISNNVTANCNVIFYQGGSITSNKDFSINSSGSLSGSNTAVNISCKSLNFYGNATLSSNTFNLTCSDKFNSSGNLTTSAGIELNIIADYIYLYNQVDFNSGNMSLVASEKLQISGNLTVNGHVEMTSPLYYFYNKITINNGGYLKVNGYDATSTVSNSITINEGTFENYSFLTVYNSFTVNSSGILITYGTIKISNKFTNNGEVTIESTSEKTGNLIYDSKDGSSNIKIKRHLTSNGWHYISSPVHNSSSNVFHSAALYSYNEPQASWDAVGANETLVNMKGYDAYFKSNSKTIVFNGQMNDGPISINVTKTATNNSNGFNLVGNPYPSAIDWNSYGWTKTNIDNAVYVWDDASQSITTYVGGIGTNGGSNIIPATMAFFVKCNNTSGGTLQVTNSARVPNYTKFREVSTDNTFKIRISGNGYSDETAINFNDQSTNVYDAEFDAEKMYSYNLTVPQIYTLSDDLKEFAINSIPNPGLNTTIPLNVYCPVNGNYSLEFDAGSFDQSYDVFIEDKLTGDVFDTKKGSYEFYSKNTENKSRFLIHFAPVQQISNSSTSTVSIDHDADASQFEAWMVNNKLHVSSVNTTEKQIKVYDIEGRIVLQTKTSNSTNTFSLNVESGVYVVNIIEGNESYSTKVIVK